MQQDSVSLSLVEAMYFAFPKQEQLVWIFCLHSLFCCYPEQSSRTNKVVITCN